MTIAYLLFFLINSGFSIPIFDKKNETIGNSKTIPAAMSIDITKLKYSFAAILFSIIVVPNPAKNPNAVGRSIKYANTIPAKKQNVEKNTIRFMYFFSFSLNAGSMNRHI